MMTSPMTRVIQNLRRAVLVRDGAGRTDGELLESFLAERDEAAFEALVHRHGPMVMGVCRRVVGNDHDAEDAFQATFLVLVRKGASVVPRQAVGNWLYGVAYRTALEARGKISRRFATEKQVLDLPDPRLQTAEAQDWRPLFDLELSRLPDKYRVPLVLCELEGRTRKEVSGQLGLPEGTLSSRLATARKKLAERLSGRGLVVSAGAMTGFLSPGAATASVPGPLAASIVKAACLGAAGQSAAGVISANVAALTEGVVKAMLMNKLKAVVALVVMIGLIAVGSGFLAIPRMAVEPTAAAAERPANPAGAQKSREKGRGTSEGPTLTGIIQTVDAEKKTLTLGIFSRKDGKIEKTLPLAKDAKIIHRDGRDGKEIKPDGLKKGNKATLTLSPDQKTIVRVLIEIPPFTAPLKSVDAGKNTITITIGPRGERQDKTYQVSKDAKISIAGKDAKLADLKEGTMVTLSINEGDTVTQIRIIARGVRMQEE